MTKRRTYLSTLASASLITTAGCTIKSEEDITEPDYDISLDCSVSPETFSPCLYTITVTSFGTADSVIITVPDADRQDIEITTEDTPQTIEARQLVVYAVRNNIRTQIAKHSYDNPIQAETPTAKPEASVTFSSDSIQNTVNVTVTAMDTEDTLILQTSGTHSTIDSEELTSVGEMSSITGLVEGEKISVVARFDGYETVFQTYTYKATL